VRPRVQFAVAVRARNRATPVIANPRQTQMQSSIRSRLDRSVRRLCCVTPSVLVCGDWSVIMSASGSSAPSGAGSANSDRVRGALVSALWAVLPRHGRAARWAVGDMSGHRGRSGDIYRWVQLLGRDSSPLPGRRGTRRAIDGSLMTIRSLRSLAAGHAFVQNLRRGHYEITVDVPVQVRAEVAFTELALCL
jgi:hypothetical protein